MKRLKLFLWIIGLLIIETVCTNRIGFFGSAPDLLFAFALAYVIAEEEFAYAIGVSVICGVCAGAFYSGNFSASVLIYTYSALLVNALRNRPRYLPDIVKLIFWSFVLSAVGEAVMYFAANLTLGLTELVNIVLPVSIYNLIGAAIIYLPAKKTLIVVDTDKKLIS